MRRHGNSKSKFHSRIGDLVHGATWRPYASCLAHRQQANAEAGCRRSRNQLRVLSASTFAYGVNHKRSQQRPCRAIVVRECNATRKATVGLREGSSNQIQEASTEAIRGAADTKIRNLASYLSKLCKLANNLDCRRATRRRKAFRCARR